MSIKSKSQTLVIGITGGLASGKSTVAGILHKLTGASIIDADKIGHSLMEPGSACWKKIVNFFGRNITKKDGYIDRKILGNIVFSSPDKLKTLEKILHPAIKSEIKNQITRHKKSKHKMVILDAPLIIEANLAYLTDKLIVISSSRKLQIERYAGRDSGRKLLAGRIIASQMPLKDKIKLADIHIKNNSSKTELKKILEKSLDKLLK